MMILFGMKLTVDRKLCMTISYMLFGLSSGAALATVVGVLIEVPVMLMLVHICKNIVIYLRNIIWNWHIVRTFRKYIVK